MALGNIDFSKLTLGNNVTNDGGIYEIKDANLQDYGQVWLHYPLVPDTSLPGPKLVSQVEKAHNRTTFCKVFGVAWNVKPLFVMPHYNTLLSNLISGGPLMLEHGLRCALDVCRCLMELHAENIHCGVLRPADVLVTSTGACVINTCSVVGNHLCSEVFTHPSYITFMAPEVIMCKFFVNGMKADVWSLACCICRMFDPDSPWPASDSPQDYCRKVHSSPPTLPSCLPSGLVELIRQCFSLSMPERPTVQEVLKGLEAAMSSINVGGLEEPPQQVSQGAVEQASCAQQVENTSERELAAAKAKVKQLERKLHELVLRSNERDEQLQKKLLDAEKELAHLQQEHATLNEKFRTVRPSLLDSPPLRSVPVASPSKDGSPINTSPIKPGFTTPRRPRTRKPVAPAVGELRDTVKMDQHTSGSSASPERPTKRVKLEPAVKQEAPFPAPGLRSPSGRTMPRTRGGLGPSRGATHGDNHTQSLKPGGPCVLHPNHHATHTNPVVPTPQLPFMHPSTNPSVRTPTKSLKTSEGPSVKAVPSPGRLQGRQREGLRSSAPQGLAAGSSRTPGSNVVSPVAAAHGVEGTPVSRSGADALLELARGPVEEDRNEPVATGQPSRPGLPSMRESKPALGSEQSASSSSLTRRDPPSPRNNPSLNPTSRLNPAPASDQPPPPASKEPLEPTAIPGPSATVDGTTGNEHATGTLAAPSSNSASISTTANVEAAGQQPQGAQDVASSEGMFTEPKMASILVGLSLTRTPLREDTGPGGILGLIMFCLNKAVAASTNKSQQGLKARLLHRSRQVLSHVLAAGWVVKEDGMFVVEGSNPGLQAALDSATEDERRKGREAFAMWCRKTFVDEVADSRIINQSRCDLLMKNTTHYLAWLDVITQLGPPQGLNEGAINLLHDTVMCYHCPDIAGSAEFMTACEALAELVNSAEKKGDKAMLLRKIYTCMAAGYLNRSMAREAQDMAGKAIVSQPKSPDLESAYWIQGAARYNLGEFSQAEESFQKALKHYQNKVAGGMHHMRTLDFLADVRARQGKWKEARKTYQEEVEVGRSKAGGGMHAEQEKAHASLARLYMCMGLFAEADAEFTEALSVLEQAGSLTFSSAEYCELRAVALADQFKVEEAAKCLERAEEIRRSLQGADAPAGPQPSTRLSGGSKELSGQEPVNVAPTTLVNMAKVAMMNAKYEDAEDYCEEVVSLDLDGADDEAAALQLQGQLFVMQHRFKEAKAKLQQVQELLVDSTDMDKVASLHYWLAQALSHLPGEETAAEEVLTQSMQSLSEKWPASSSPGGAAEYLNPRLECLLGQLQAARGSVNDDHSLKSQGLQRCKAGVEAAVKVWGKQHPYYAACLRHVAWAQMACFSYEAALVTLAEERKVWQTLEGGRDGLEYAGLAHARAHCHYALQRYGDAERLYRAAAGIFQKVYPGSSLHKWSMVGALAALQDNPSSSRTPQAPAVREVCDVVGCNEKKLLQWLDRHRQYWNPAGRR